MYSPHRRGSGGPSCSGTAAGIQHTDKLPGLQPADCLAKGADRQTELKKRAVAAPFLKPPSRTMRALRDKALLPGWKGLPSAAHRHAQREGRPPERAHAGHHHALPELPAHIKTRRVQMVESSSSRTASTPCHPPNPRPPAAQKINRQSLSSRSKRFPTTAGTPSPPPPPQSPSQDTHFRCAEDVIEAGVCSPPDIARVIRSNPHLGFLYLMSVVPKSSVDYDPFNLKVTTYQNLSKYDYHTISLHGVMSITKDGRDFMALDRWEHDYHLHRRLRSIATIVLFPKWKAFRMWHRNIRAKKIRKDKVSLQQSLFILNQSLRPALMDIREMCYRLSDLGLCRMETDRTYTLQEFLEIQQQQLQEVSARLGEFRQLVKEVAMYACRTATLEAGYSLDSNLNKQEKLSYLGKKDKRQHCFRLTCFLRLIDYLVVHTMYTLMRNSLARLLTVFQEQVGQTPGHATIRSWGQHGTTAAAPSEDTTMEVEAEEQQQEEVVEEEALDEVTPRLGDDGGPATVPMFTTELMLDTHSLTYQPSEDQFQETIGEIIGRFRETVLSVDTLLPDDDFNLFTQPIINNQVEDKTCGDGPCLETVLEDDNHLQSIIQNIKQSLQVAFDSANVYSCTFEHFRNFYKENESLDLDELRTRDHDVQFFEKSLKKYHSQYKQALAIEQQRQLGLLLVDTTQLQNNLTPSSQRCLEAIHERLPLLAKKMLDSIVSEAEDAKFRLELVPSATTEFVNSLTFLDEIQERVTLLEEQQETVCQMYGLMETYAVPAPAEDFVLFATLQPSVAAMQSAVDRSVVERDANVEEFCGCLSKDIKELNQEVEALKQKAKDFQILDIDSDASKVRQLLAEIQISIDELHGQAFTYTSYQKKIQVEVTGFDALVELSAEVRLKRLLWDSLEEWDSIHDSWMQSAFDQLDSEQLSAQVNKYSKSVSQLEKGLATNSAVLRLKCNVDSMRDKLPVITDLHNPCLKSRHWETLERVVDASLTEEPLSLTMLERLGVFSYAAEIQEVSGQASGEASLEIILKKMEDLWWATEFTVLSHRDAKDVFILGGTDDIQVLLDDSIINIAMVASSRHVEPIEGKVGEWQTKLALFSHTLEEWLTCQRSWLYLESIFSAPDIHRELATESKMFQQVDKSWKEIMRKVDRHRNTLRAATRPGLLETLQNNNALLDQIQKCLEAYLESKRVIFPRFYFLSNDELLEILAQTRNPQAVQPHLRKCFDSVVRLEFALAPPPGPQMEGGGGAEPPERVYSNDILAMVSPEGEKV